ncbi:tyrosine protein kinase [Cohnella herbarum]|uniref:Tyrosine protein kinase n=1 Tax=Cohnella herbarum TaxID=2728023 RepID=A0A7Z2VKN0_9BACL|nr:tyrosine protein kinase [Cohnella herbarum]QJD84751.1 tyrosine protein kinase [Cohnella herbarum]
MSEPLSSSLNSWNSGFGQDPFPGIESSFSGPPAAINPTVIPPQVQVVEATKATKGGLPFNLSNLSDLKSMVDRMGGIEGVLATMGKVQKFVSTMQQVAPMIKLFMGNKGKKSSDTKTKTKRRRRPVKRSTSRKRRSRRSAKKR